jgi:biopolymer transport protein ExbB
MRVARLGLAAALALAAASSSADAQEAAPESATAERAESEAERPLPAPPEPKTLDQLLEMVKEGFEAERVENREREEVFLRERERQDELLAEVEQELAGAEARSQALEKRYNTNEGQLGLLQERLADRLGQLGELFGVVRQVATDLSSQVWDSLTSSQLGPRDELLERLGRSTELPSTQDLRQLWYELQREMTEQGKVVRYTAAVLDPDGERRQREVIRAGPFTAVADGKFLLWEPNDQMLRELVRQPPSRYLNTVAPFEHGGPGLRRLAVDPTRGSVLNALTDTPSFTERIQQGGYVGYVILVLGAVAVVLGLVRAAVISITSRKVAAQQEREDADPGNPLGRVLGVYERNRDLDPETLELKLDEAVMRESSKLERFIWVVRVVSVVAPLLGLLGTVTGMIQTFQAITLYGAGDPKMMAGGISEALVTTMLGLTTAIPLVLLHAMLSSSASRVTDVLDQQSAGLVALRSEKANA